MAHIIPSNAGPAIISVAERCFLDAAIRYLDDDFWVFHSVPWLQVESRQVRQGECDFLILHPRLGLISIEAKPGDITYDSKSGVWYRSDGELLKNDPFLQAQRSAHALKQLLQSRAKGWTQHQLPHSFAVYFCGADHVKGHFPAHALPSIMLLQGDLPRLKERLAGVAKQFGSTSAQPLVKLVQEAIAVLRPEFRLVRTMSTQLKMLDDEFLRLTEAQSRVLDLMRDSRRVLVKGCAGSGKTLLALEKAMRLASEGLKVLLLCYNIPLAEWLKVTASRENSDVTVSHFHGICEQFSKFAGISYKTPDGQSRLTEFFDTVAPNCLDHAIKAGVGPRFDAIIVDEGQDFIGEWWIIIEDLLKDQKNGYLYIFYDPDQNIFSRKFGFLIEEAKVTLDRICRNTRQISGYVNRVSGMNHEAADFTMDGPEPCEVEVTTDEEELAAVEKIVRELIFQKKIHPEQIVIVGSRRRQNSPFSKHNVIAGIPLIDEADENADGAIKGKIRYATVYRFKGLESDCAIVIGFRRPNRLEKDSLFYCAASRAKSLLYLIYRS